MKVLVIDDSVAIRSRLAEVLSTLQGVERVDTVARASEARHAIQSARPDVVVLDIHLPDGSGLDVLEAFRTDDQRIVTIVLTNDPASQWRTASLRAGADFFFDKSAEFQRAVDVIAGVALGRQAIEVNARLVYGNGEPVGSQGIARDISERERLERGLRQGQKMEAIGRLAGGVAHDFNNLLTVILGRSQEMIERLAPDDPTRADVVQIRNAGERAADLTRQLLAFSRQQILAPKILDLNAVVDRLAPMLRRLVGQDIDVVIRTSAAPFAVKADPRQLERVIMNLVVNARDAMPEGGTLTIETANAECDADDVIDRLLLQSGRYVVLVVRDTGFGMDAHTKARIFEPFFKANQGGTGTGLGLSTASGIVKQSGGYIFVDSEPGKGTTFSLHFPHAAGQLDAAFQRPVVPRSDRGSESILLVEEDGGVREFARHVLVARGYDVLVASSPGEALRLSDASPRSVDLLLTDVALPGMTGRALAATLRGRHARMKVIYMSGYTTEVIVDQGVLDPSVSFVAKPFEASVLAMKVREVLDEV